MLRSSRRLAWSSFVAILQVERDRVTLWAPVAVIAGAAARLTMSMTVSPWLGLGMIGLGLAVAALALLGAPRRAWGIALMVASVTIGVGLAGFGLGFTAADARIVAVAKPRPAEPIGPVLLEGWVLRVDPGARRARLTVRVALIDGAPSPLTTVSVSSDVVLPPGRAMRCRVILRPAEPPMAPGGYDSARRAFFEGIGASGFSVGACRAAILARAPNEADRLTLTVAAWRRDLTESIAASAPGAGGALAAALITGDRSLVPTEILDVYRDSGLGHFLSVSGLHMGIVAGLAFACLHGALALIAPVALRFPIRKWAAMGAILCAGAYLVVSGASVPAQRAFVMTTVTLGAILVDRPAITLRGLALAALIVTLLTPEAVLDPGFQMSFAATAALVAAFEWVAARRAQPARPGPFIGGLQDAWGAVVATLTTSLIAGLATDLFAAFHFQRFAVYALITNLATTPLISFVIAPAAGAAAVLAPFGWSEPALWVMAWGLEHVTAIAAVFGASPANVSALPPMPLSAFLLGVAALLWGCLWRGPLRLGALAMALGAAAIYLTAPRPILVADAELHTVVMRVRADDRMIWAAIRPERGGDFALSRLATLAGISPSDVATLAPPPGCLSAEGCTWEASGSVRVRFLANTAAWSLPCKPEDLVLTRTPPPPEWRVRCRPGLLLVATPERGGVRVVQTPTGPRADWALNPSDVRPWRRP